MPPAPGWPFAGRRPLSEMPFEPVILFFVLGAIAGFIRSDLKIPGVLYESLSIFLLIAIGLKGGVELARYPLLEVAGPALVAVLAGMLIPLVAFPILLHAGPAVARRRRLARRALRLGQRRHLRGRHDLSGRRRRSRPRAT